MIFCFMSSISWHLRDSSELNKVATLRLISGNVILLRFQLSASLTVNRRSLHFLIFRSAIVRGGNKKAPCLRGLLRGLFCVVKGLKSSADAVGCPDRANSIGRFELGLLQLPAAGCKKATCNGYTQHGRRFGNGFCAAGNRFAPGIAACVGLCAIGGCNTG